MNEILTCPWSGWDPPALSFCEAALCAWIKTPANTWSNLAFIFVGIYILIHEIKQRRLDLIGYGPMCMGVGVFSFLYHASLTRLGEIGDISSMFLISAFLMATTLRRRNKVTLLQGRSLFWFIYLTSTALLFVWKDVGAPLFFIQCMFALYQELRMRSLKTGPSSYRYLWAGGAFWLTAQTIWALDLFKIVCDPHNHWLQGHAVWHVLMAGLALMIYFHNDLAVRERINA